MGNPSPTSDPVDICDVWKGWGEMDVVGHQAIASCFEAEALAVLTEESDLRTAVVNNEENILPVLAALSNVARLTRNDDSGHVGHADNPFLAGRKVNKQPHCPSLFFFVSLFVSLFAPLCFLFVLLSLLTARYAHFADNHRRWAHGDAVHALPAYSGPVNSNCSTPKSAKSTSLSSSRSASKQSGVAGGTLGPPTQPR